MSTPGEVIDTLDGLSRELGDLASSLTKVERDLEPVEALYEQFCASHEIGLWQQHQDGKLTKWPSESLRVRLAHADMPPELLGRHAALVASRKRLEKRIGTVKTIVDAQRSILSALKVELEAAR